MTVKNAKTDGLKRSTSIVVTAKELQAKVDEKLEVARRDFQMKGFRKGHAPAALMKKMFGKSVLGEAMQESIDGAMKAHFETTGDRPALQPEVKMTNEDWKEGDDVHVSLTYEALPEVPAADFSKLKIEKLVPEVDDKALDEALANLAKAAPSFEPRKKGSKAKEGDQVVIDFKGTVGGEVFEGGSAEDFPLVLGSNSFIPGFEAQLTGAKAGDAVEVKVTFPATYGVKALAGKDAVFACTVKEVKEPKPGTIDDAMAKRFGAENLEALKTQVSERLAEEYAGAARQVQKRRLMDALDKMVSFDLPEGLVKAEADQVAHQLWHEENKDVHDHSHDHIEPTKEHMKLAERRVRLGLLLADVGTKADITVTDAEMQQAVIRQARQYRGQERAYIEFLQKNQAAQQQIRAPIFEDKVVDHILTLAKVTEKKVSKAELEKAVEALETE